MKRIAAALTAFACLSAWAAPALAWGPSGHRLVGAVADRLLTPHARQAVYGILGYNLATAATWADCAKSVQRHADGTFHYTVDPHHPEYTAPCHAFETPAETARLEAYVKANWDHCPEAPERACHETYHFADVPLKRGRYDRAYAGTNDHDIVSALQAAIFKLQNPGQAAPAPFVIADRKTALLLLAHFMGDLHQPLHVGSVYLDDMGRLVDPMTPADVLEATHTQGGNLLLVGGQKLHGLWDGEPFGAAPDAQMVSDAKGIAKTSDPLESWPKAWASEGVKEADIAFQGLSYGPKSGHRWPVTAPNGYGATRADLQRTQMVKAGARLAQLLNAIYP